ARQKEARDDAAPDPAHAPRPGDLRARVPPRLPDRHGPARGGHPGESDPRVLPHALRGSEAQAAVICAAAARLTDQPQTPSSRLRHLRGADAIAVSIRYLEGFPAAPSPRLPARIDR